MKNLIKRASQRKKKIKRHTKPYTPGEYVSKIFPNSSKDFIEHIIWGLTGYPYFWNISKDGKTPYQCFTKQVREVKAKLNKGISIDQQTFESWDRPLAKGREDDFKELRTKIVNSDNYNEDREISMELYQQGLSKIKSKDELLKAIDEEISRASHSQVYIPRNDTQPVAI